MNVVPGSSRMRRVAAFALLAFAGCSERGRSAPRLFELLSPAATGVSFSNVLPERPDFNILNHPYYYNGAGVAIGDVDNDGLPDLYFTSNLQHNRLYLNKGNYHFEDVTDRAGVAGAGGWTTGATMADVNGDGFLDIYVSAVNYLAMRGHNVLYINDRDGTFTDRTTEYGLDFSGYSTQAAFFDYDGDGDLDVYLLNQSVHAGRSIGRGPFRENRDPLAGDRLYRNDGGHFTDVSASAGIYGSGEASGLGVVASDINLDGCPDLYISNDFQADDLLYINNCDGTFSERLRTAIGHTSRFSMGVDAADFNNDGRPDLMVVDMLPAREDILKTSANAESFEIYEMKLRAGYHPQYSRNTLQLNRGLGKFSEIGYLAGVDATDWSWAPLFADLDNDGRKDLFISNGIYRRPNDLDYIDYVGKSSIQASLAKGISEAENRALLQKMPQVPIANFAFHNNGDLTFTDQAAPWGLAQPGFSNGAAYVDLDNSGALDLVVSNINAPASIYRNRSRDVNRRGWLTVVLKGEGKNTGGIGSKVMITAGGSHQLLEQFPTRGFQSSVDPRLHFGVDTAARIDSLTVIWPDRRFQVLTNVQVNRTLVLSQSAASGRYDYERAAPPPLFEDVTARMAIDYHHRENPFLDFSREPLMTSVLSAEGPALAVGDVDGDGLDDIYAGGAKWQPGKLLLQGADGGFRSVSRQVFQADSLAEDVDAAFFDANGDGRPDLYVVSAGNEFTGESAALRDRLYINDGAGQFHRSDSALPAVYDQGSCVVPGDFDGDGDVDLFVGSRVVAQRYGMTPESHLLQNDGSGRFTDVTAQKSDDIAAAGMVTSAAWIDYDADGKLDLIVTGEWMAVRVFHQEDGRFVDRTTSAGFGGSEGWWGSVTVADLNGDQRPDLVLGNLGLNSYVRGTAKEPAKLYVGDFGENGSVEQILTVYKGGASYPVAGRDELVSAVPSLRTRYPSYASFGASTIDDIFPASARARATVRTASNFATSVAINSGKGTFVLRALPAEAQFAPVRAALARDFDGDGLIDLLLGGNFFGVTPAIGRYDASYGELLHGDGAGNFSAVPMDQSKLLLDGEIRALRELRVAGGDRLIIAARNDTTLQVLRPLGVKASAPPIVATGASSAHPQ